MAQHWKEMLPIDRYTVASNGILHEYDRKIITLLYQPLIGPIAMSLYMTLWAQVEENRLWSGEQSHHGLMTSMDLNLKSIHEARLKLEGIGLLKTFVQAKEESRSFIYEVQPPLQPDRFFLDGMLNIYLYQKVGKNQFVKLKQFFSDKSIPTDEYKNVTRSFQDVYDSSVPSSMIEEIEQDSDQIYVGRAAQKGIKVDETAGFDFELLQAGLSESLVPKKALNQKVRDAISNLAYLYGIDPIQMKNLLISAMDDVANKVNVEELRKAARDWYQLEHQDKLPKLVDKVQPTMKQTGSSEPKTQEEKLVHYLETTSPRQLLSDISGGADPSKADLQIIEDVMFKQKLLPGVVNVLIQYVLLKTDMKLTKGYVDKIASHWTRKKISTVKEAMDLAIKEHRQYMEWAENKKSPKASSRKQPIRTEALPAWFDEKENEGTQNQQVIDNDKSEIEELLREFKNRG
ncbi:Replication initiation and membrane attachment protein [Robertmurraya yapensis]|uniref:Replication initiation and membrane attachment protein n=1 Tax=Bacillus yapensis TaxID=2492960 RepID=A0A3S0JV97_9BACI|nr:replication initiation and membrane attachment family protein [Bacillus yapensis]RTR29645.1 Replication initiation and membrane attachment protein [Bacillus yapensis]TKS94991.1 Replication initiation and membrane attachment protein [Bacillus yapensis]